MNTALNLPTASALARQMIDSREAPFVAAAAVGPHGRPRPEVPLRRPACGADATPVSALALAWALKDLCFAAWSTEPQRAAKAADALCALCIGEDAGAAAPSQAREVQALADWTAGIAHLTRGHMAEATQCFDLAAEIFRSLGQADHAAQTQVPKIMALSMLGQYDAAGGVERVRRAGRRARSGQGQPQPRSPARAPRRLRIGGAVPK